MRKEGPLFITPADKRLEPNGLGSELRFKDRHCPPLQSFCRSKVGSTHSHGSFALFGGFLDEGNKWFR